MKMGREGHHRLSFDSEIVFLRKAEGLAAQRGQARRAHARMVRATAGETRPHGPLTGPDPAQGQATPAALAPPTRGTDAPFNSQNGWRAWWPAPNLTGSGYEMPDPPTEDPPILPSRATPFLWEVVGEVRADSTWSLPELIGLRALADSKDVSGRETIVDEGDVAVTTSNLYLPAQTMSLIMNKGNSAFAKEWDCRVRGSGCDITAVMETHDRRFVKLVVEQR